MNAGRALVWVGFLAMAASLTWAFSVGHFWTEGSVLMSLPWGKVTLIDFYTGASLFCGWVAYRERSVWKTIIWVVLVVLLGNLMTTLYVLLALRTSRQDARLFWMGRRAPKTTSGVVF